MFPFRLWVGLYLILVSAIPSKSRRGRAHLAYRECNNQSYFAEFPCGHKLNQGYHDVMAVGKCIKFVNEERPWYLAYKLCRAEGCKLLEFKLPTDYGIKTESVQNYWIGLNDIDEEGVFRWNRVHSTLAKQGNYPPILENSHWGKDEPDGRRRDDDCVLRDKDGLWWDAGCAYSFGYICESVSGRNPGPPNLTIHFHEAPNVLHQGRTFNITCTGFQSHIATFELRVKRTTIIKYLGDPVSTETKFSVDYDEGRCGLIRSTTLTETALLTYDNTTIECCSINLGDPLGKRSQTKFVSCSQSSRIVIKAVPQTPNLTLDKKMEPAETVRASCSACVGEAGYVGGKISYAGTMSSWQFIIKKPVHPSKPVEVEETIQNALPGEVILHAEGFYHLKCGPGINVSLAIHMAERTEWAVITCQTPKLITRLPLEITKSHSYYLPELHVYYHRPPNIVTAGELLEAVCSADPGAVFQMMWQLGGPGLNTTRWVLDPEGPFLVEDFRLRVAVSHTVEKDTEKGITRINTTFQVVVSGILDGAVLICSTSLPNGPEEEIWTLNRAKLAMRRSKVLTIKYSPRDPELNVSYHAPPDGVYDNRTLVCQCSAFVGSDGALSWLVISHWKVTIWTIDTRGNVFGRGAQEIKAYGGGGEEEIYKDAVDNVRISHSPATHDRDFGPHLRSKFTISVSASLRNGIIACYSREISTMGSYSPITDRLCASSQPLIILSPGAVDNAYSAGVFEPVYTLSSLVGSAAMLLFFLLTFTLCRKKASTALNVFYDESLYYDKDYSFYWDDYTGATTSTTEYREHNKSRGLRATTKISSSKTTTSTTESSDHNVPKYIMGKRYSVATTNVDRSSSV